MSLDVFLRRPGHLREAQGPTIYIREDGQIKTISREAWDVRYPGREPVTVHDEATDLVYSANITHNVGAMAALAGIYHVVWHPEKYDITTAGQLIAPLRHGVGLMRQDSGAFTLAAFRALEPENQWGTYDTLLAFVEAYLAACETYPDAVVEVSR